jgi:hypothetical protein
MKSKQTIQRIETLLDIASELADEAATGENKSSGDFTALTQLIDYALARCKSLVAKRSQT